jgi:superfamily I DNA/RNA helicase
VHRVAEWVSSRIAVRRPKTWAPRDEDGEVTILRNPVFLREAMRKDRGRWMFLVRNRYLLAKYEKLAQGLGVYYRVKSGTSYTNSLGAKLRDAIVAWQELTTGESLSLRQALNLLKFMDSAKAAETKQTMLDGKDGDKDVVYFPAGQWPDWEEALNRIPPTKVGYIRRMLARGENLFSEPQTTIATIHSVKGGEADNVVVDLEMARTSWQEMRRAPDNEHRVWYVGFTRAKQRLYIVQSGSQYSYSVGGLHERELVAAGAVA